jgi:hypothetical protein
VIAIASIDGIAVNPLETYSYAASKSGLIHMTRRMALRLAQDEIVVSTIAPGAFASDMNRAARDHGSEIARRFPMQRIGRDDDMADAAFYLASRAGDYVAGGRRRRHARAGCWHGVGELPRRVAAERCPNCYRRPYIECFHFRTFIITLPSGPVMSPRLMPAGHAPRYLASMTILID